MSEANTRMPKVGEVWTLKTAKDVATVLLIVRDRVVLDWGDGGFVPINSWKMDDFIEGCDPPVTTHTAWVNVYTNGVSGCTYPTKKLADLVAHDRRIGCRKITVTEGYEVEDND